MFYDRFMSKFRRGKLTGVGFFLNWFYSTNTRLRDLEIDRTHTNRNSGPARTFVPTRTIRRRPPRRLLSDDEPDPFVFFSVFYLTPSTPPPPVDD